MLLSTNPFSAAKGKGNYCSLVIINFGSSSIPLGGTSVPLGAAAFLWEQQHPFGKYQHPSGSSSIPLGASASLWEHLKLGLLGQDRSQDITRHLLCPSLSPGAELLLVFLAGFVILEIDVAPCLTRVYHWDLTECLKTGLVLLGQALLGLPQLINEGNVLCWGFSFSGTSA